MAKTKPKKEKTLAKTNNKEEKIQSSINQHNQKENVKNIWEISKTLSKLLEK